jgi:hypothetical protein
MFLTSLAERATLVCTTTGEDGSSELIIDCAPTEESGVLEIGKTHIFAHENEIRIVSDRKRCGLKIYVKRRSLLSEERIAKIGLGKEKIGLLGFYPDHAARDFVPSRPASLEASVFVNDQMFETIVSAVLAGRKAELIYLYIEKKETLEFGWEPDGSRLIWKIDDATKPSYVNIPQLEIRFALYG